MLWEAAPRPVLVTLGQGGSPGASEPIGKLSRMRRLPLCPRLLLGSLFSAWPLRPTFPGASPRGQQASLAVLSLVNVSALFPPPPVTQLGPQAARPPASPLHPSVRLRGLATPRANPALASSTAIQPVSEALPGRAPACLSPPLRTTPHLQPHSSCPSPISVPGTLSPGPPPSYTLFPLLKTPFLFHLPGHLPSTLRGPVRMPLLHPLPIYLPIKRL